MEEKDVRSLTLLGVVLLFFPVWIPLHWLYDAGIRTIQQETGSKFPAWVNDWGGIFLLFAVFLTLAYTAAGWLDRKYPNSKPRPAAWDEQGR